MDILSAFGGGGLLGIAGTVLSGIEGFFRRKQEHAQAMDLARLRLEEMDKEAEHAAALANIKADADALAGSIQADRASYVNVLSGLLDKSPKWVAAIAVLLMVLVDFARGMVRPTITWAAMAILWRAWATAVVAGIMEQIIAASIGVILWWFGGRMMTRSNTGGVR